MAQIPERTQPIEVSAQAWEGALERALAQLGAGMDEVTDWSLGPGRLDVLLAGGQKVRFEVVGLGPNPPRPSLPDAGREGVVTPAAPADTKKESGSGRRSAKAKGAGGEL